MTPKYYEYYDIGLTRSGTYEEILNTDKDVYGGSNAYNGLKLTSTENGPYNKPYKMTIKLAGFAACFFRFVKN